MVQTLVFFSGGTAYNLTVFVMACVGIILGVWALCIAYCQLKRVADAAVAAQAAANDARTRVQSITSLMDLTDLCTLAREVQAHLRSQNTEAAALRASDLRFAVGRVRLRSRDSEDGGDTRWGALVSKIASLDNALLKNPRTIDVPPDDGGLHRMAGKIIDTLNDIVGDLASELGEK